MKIKCTCGQLIIDQTDGHTNKGHIIPDSQWFSFWDAVDEAIEQPDLSPAKRTQLVMKLRQLPISRAAWECFSCGKLYINGDQGALIAYTPDTNAYNRVLHKKGN